MSAQQTLCYCFDCQMIDYGIPNKNGVFERGSSATMHWDHDYHIFGNPFTYQPPIRTVLIKLQTETKITDFELSMFRLAIALGELDGSRSIEADDGKELALGGKDRIDEYQQFAQSLAPHMGEVAA